MEVMCEYMRRHIGKNRATITDVSHVELYFNDFYTMGPSTPDGAHRGNNRTCDTADVSPPCLNEQGLFRLTVPNTMEMKGPY